MALEDTADNMAREMLCYCLNLTYRDVRRLWEKGYFESSSTHQAGDYCTGCIGDLKWYLAQLTASPAMEESEFKGGCTEAEPRCS